jgi:hypothetical protein
MADTSLLLAAEIYRDIETENIIKPSATET